MRRSFCPAAFNGHSMKVAVIGAGASGLMAAFTAAKNGNDVTVFEKNEKAERKFILRARAGAILQTTCRLKNLLIT
ncbi:MAG: FAD-dependent oxidoreductase [Candidatus Coproplasma sp.]